MINVLKTKKYISDRYALARQKAWSGDFSDVVVSNVGFLLDLYHRHCLFFFSHLFSCNCTCSQWGMKTRSWFSLELCDFFQRHCLLFSLICFHVKVPELRKKLFQKLEKLGSLLRCL